MSYNSFMDRMRSFFGLPSEPPRNDFRNPIWGSDDDDDGDELYTRQQIEAYSDPVELHRELTKHMQDIFNNFGSLFGDMKAFFGQADPETFSAMTQFPPIEQEPETFDSNRIRDYYLKPGYHETHIGPKQDIDLDGKISSEDISGLLKQRENPQFFPPASPFSGNVVPGKSFCQTIITTSVTKPDGTVETRRIVKNGNEVTEETTTSTRPGPIHPYFPGPSTIDSTHMMFSQLSSFLRNFY